MADILREIVSNKREEVASRKSACSTAKIRKQVHPAKGSFLPALSAASVQLIAEIKPKSPSAGQLRTSVNVSELASLYGKYCAAISVLTDSKYFGGSLDALETVASSTDVPVLCKDFVIDEHQILEARLRGAEAVLLIAKILDSDQLARLHEAAVALNMVPVVEIQNEAELETALAVGPRAILINNRDLSTFDIDLSTTERLAPLIPRGVKVIAASGIETKEDILRLRRLTNAFLVGSSLMRSDDVEQKLIELCRPFLVKTCGISSTIDASTAISLGADLIGIIFAESSLRRVSFEQAKAICNTVGGDKVVAVFQNQSLNEIKSLRKSLGFKYVQLHGDESPDMVRDLCPAIKAISIADQSSIATAAAYAPHADFVLFDKPKFIAEKPLNWLLRTVQDIGAHKPSFPFLLAGGLTVSTVGGAVQNLRHTNLIGVDVASGVESAPAVKDIRLIKQFIEEARTNGIAR